MHAEITRTFCRTSGVLLDPSKVFWVGVVSSKGHVLLLRKPRMNHRLGIIKPLDNEDAITHSYHTQSQHLTVKRARVKSQAADHTDGVGGLCRTSPLLTLRPEFQKLCTFIIGLCVRKISSHWESREASPRSMGERSSRATGSRVSFCVAFRKMHLRLCCSRHEVQTGVPA